MAEDKCPCIIADGNKCIDCGEPVTNPEITVQQLAEEGIVLGPPLPPDAPVPSLGNVAGIMHLAMQTFREGVRRQARNTDPVNTSLPKLQLMGSVFVRVPHKDIWVGLLRQSFEQAQAMGFKGTSKRWEALVEEACPEQ